VEAVGHAVLGLDDVCQHPSRWSQVRPRWVTRRPGAGNGVREAGDAASRRVSHRQATLYLALMMSATTDIIKAKYRYVRHAMLGFDALDTLYLALTNAKYSVANRHQVRWPRWTWPR